MITKNREREDYSFANINLLGKCNAKCFFCLGEDIPNLLGKHNQLRTHFTEWSNFKAFLDQCADLKIKKLYLTGQNTDALLYKYRLGLVDYLQTYYNFDLGIRTNGFLALKNLEFIKRCRGETGFSIHTLKPKTAKDIMGYTFLPQWGEILRTFPCRVSIVLNRYNVDEFYDILRYLHGYRDNIKYIQVRRISTDTREEQFTQDIELYEQKYQEFQELFPSYGNFYLATQHDFYGMEVNFWRTVETSVNSLNYFTDGTISDEYFVVEGYLKNYKQTKKL